ncbi:MAG: hypothetical protein J0L66_07490 [Cytophagales bacterium]|nr:hypothetical protein [Cytophagales bacterium]
MIIVVGGEYYPSQLIGVGLRYNYGVTNIKTLNIDKQYNQALQLSFIVRIPGHQLKQAGF